MSKSERKLTPTEIRILYWLQTHQGFRGSKVQLRKRMGYPSDGSVNRPLNGLIAKGYVKEDANDKGSAFRLTGKGRNKILFLRLPAILALAIGFVGIGELYAALENVFGGVALSPFSPLVGGLVLLVMSVFLLFVLNRIANDFLGIRQPLEESESLPREDREPSSTS